MESRVSDFSSNQIRVNWGVSVLQKKSSSLPVVCWWNSDVTKILNELKLFKSSNCQKIFIESYLHSQFEKTVKIMVDFIKKDTKRDLKKWFSILGYRELECPQFTLLSMNNS